jgi:hypothetical protein
MKFLSIVALVAAQAIGFARPVAAQPTAAVNIGPANPVQTGAFGGLRLRIPLGSNSTGQRVRAGLTIAPMLHSQTRSGEMRMQIGEGVEFGFSSGTPPALSIAGRPIGRNGLHAAQAEDADHSGPSTALIIGGAVLVVAAIGAALAYHALDEASE